MIIREMYLSQIRPFYDSDIVKVITGIRRSGKSSILKSIISELSLNGLSDRIIYLPLDKRGYKDIDTPEKLEKRIEEQIKDSEKYYLIIDEVQNVKGFEKVVLEYEEEGYSIFLTGSNSYLLSDEISTKLTGRYITFETYPLDFYEYLEMKKFFKKNIKLRKKSVIGDNSVTYIACNKTTMPENGTIMFYIDGGFDEEWSSVTWNVSRKLKKDAPVEWYEPEYGYNQEPFYLHGLEEGTYQVYAGPDITKTNVITVTVTKSTDSEKRFVAPGKIWAPKNIYLVGGKCWLDVVTDKPVKDVEWTILSLYKKTEQTLRYTEGTHFYFTCRNEGIYRVTAKTNYKDGTFAEDTVRIVSTVKNPQTTEGFWIRYDHLDNFYNYIYPRRSSGYMVKNSKIYK